MFKKSEISKLEKSLPKEGKKKISLKGNLSLVTIYKFFNNESVKDSTAEKIWTVGWNIIKEHKDRVEQLKSLMND